MPTPKIVAGWAGQVPPSFRFTLKANRRITHDKRLKDVGDSVEFFVTTARELGPQLGALLFQTPPNLKCNLERVRRLPGHRARRACRRRSSSGTTRGSTTRSTRACAPATSRCAWPTPRRVRCRSIATADFAYLRLRDEGLRRRGDSALDGAGAGAVDAVPRRLRVLQARGRRQGRGLRPAHDRAAGAGLTRAAARRQRAACVRGDEVHHPALRPVAVVVRRRLGAPMNPQCPPWRVTTRVSRATSASAGSRAASGGTNGSSSAVMSSAGTASRVEHAPRAGAVVVVGGAGKAVVRRRVGVVEVAHAADARRAPRCRRRPGTAAPCAACAPRSPRRKFQ